jgi:hypothetical protein
MARGWVVKNWEFHSRAFTGRSESPAIVEAFERIQLNVPSVMRDGPAVLLVFVRRQPNTGRRYSMRSSVRTSPKRVALLEAHILHTGKVIGRDYDKLAARSASNSPVKKQKRPANQK